MGTTSFNTMMTLKSIAFISHSKHRQILADVLMEIDKVALIGAERSTLYLSMSTLEGILLYLIKNQPNAEKHFPKEKNGSAKKVGDLNFDEMITVANKLKFIENEYIETFQKMKDFRNYMHPKRELREEDRIDLGVSQISLGILNHILCTLGKLRFINGNIWQVISGEPIYESSIDKIEFNKGNMRTDSFIITEDYVGREIRITFDLILSGNCLLNFVYNYESDSIFEMLRFDIRKETDNGFLSCRHYANWDYLKNSKFTFKLSDTQPNKIEITCSPKDFIVTINGVSIDLTNSQYTKFDKMKKLGFFNELNPLAVSKLKITLI